MSALFQFISILLGVLVITGIAATCYLAIEYVILSYLGLRKDLRDFEKLTDRKPVK